MKRNTKNTPRGKLHYNWKGGIAEYPDHSLMKRNRLIRLKQTKGRCEICSKQAHKIHHKDENKSNHDLKNLSVVCNKCHGILHTSQPRKTSKFIRTYGMTLESMAKKFGGTPTLYWKNHKNGNLKSFLAELQSS